MPSIEIIFENVVGKSRSKDCCSLHVDCHASCAAQLIPEAVAASPIGGRAPIVNAADAEAAAFWGRRGFIPSKDDPLVLFRSIAHIAASLR